MTEVAIYGIGLLTVIVVLVVIGVQLIVAVSREKPYWDLVVVMAFVSAAFLLGKMSYDIATECDGVVISPAVVLAGLMSLVGVVAAGVRWLLWWAENTARGSGPMALRHIDRPILMLMIGFFAFAVLTGWWEWSVEAGSVLPSVLVAVVIAPPMQYWPQYVPALLTGLRRSDGDAV
ncbi:hypothetical protein [Nesterenkonia halobia]|uniref:Uncharacterized protein n=1 Tax=Nesterenkonia halobia TaxID=37922 RepID=A0ABP6R7L7_9MICC